MVVEKQIQRIITMASTNNALFWGLAGAGALVALNAWLSTSRKTDFRGKTIVITGGSRGLGLVTARQLAQEGANIAICARDEAELEAARAELLPYSGHILAEPCDVSNQADVDRFFDSVRSQLGPVDVLINVAGIIVLTPLENATDDDFREAMDINFWGAYYCINAVLPDMRRRGAGRIVNVASLGGKVAAPHLLPYVTSKFALVGYSEGLRTELTRHNIFVTTVCPGLIRTGSTRQTLVRGQHEKEYAWFKTADSLPGLSVSAESCARDLINGCRYGRPEVIVSVPAQVAAVVQGVAPNLMAEILTAINYALPGPATGHTNERKLGKESESAASKTVFTTLTDEAAEQNNQMVHR